MLLDFIYFISSWLVTQHHTVIVKKYDVLVDYSFTIFVRPKYAEEQISSLYCYRGYLWYCCQGYLCNDKDISTSKCSIIYSFLLIYLFSAPAF